jgi:ribosomal protein S3
MGNRSNSNFLRIGTKKDWLSNWFVEKNQFYLFLQNDFIIYKFFYYNLYFKEKLLNLRIIRFSKKIVLFFSLVNKKNFYFKKLKLNPLIFKNKSLFLIFIKDKNYKNNSFFIASKIGILIENKVNFRSSIIRKLIKDFFLVKNVLIVLKGRINNIEMAKKDFITKGSIPFQKLKFKIDFSLVVLNTLKGSISLKIWSCF